MFGGLLFLCGMAAIVYMTAKPAPEVKNATVRVGTTNIVADVADTGAARQRGLSGRESLPWGTGLLFVFETDGNWGIWMKEMHFPLDIIWAGSDGTIITIAQDVAPESYPKVFYPSAPTARYVLELPAGFTAEHAIAEGQKIVVQ